MPILSRSGIGIRLGASFALLLVLLLIITIVSISQMKVQYQSSENFVTQNVSRVLLSSKINIHAQSAALSLLQILSTTEREQRIPLYKEMDEQNNRLNDIISQLTNEANQSKTSHIDKLVKNREQYRRAFLETVDLIELEPSEAMTQFSRDTRPALAALLNTINIMLEDESDEMHREHELTKSDNEQARNTIIILSVVAFLLGCALAYLVSRSITVPLKQSVALAKKIASGDLTPARFPQRNDELGELTQALDQMQQQLSSLISSIQTSSVQLQESSTMLSTPVGSVESGSLAQQTAVVDIIDVINEFTQQINQSATTAEEAKQQSENASNLAAKGSQLICEATTEFENISRSISNSAEAVETLKERAISVRNLITTVREIADQTNLLALNAAIEAARAGESGRGFSVVADEVRSLAGRTGQATSEINDVIDAMDKETHIAVERIVTGREEMENGVELLQQMVEPLSELDKGAKISLAKLEDLEHAVIQQSNESNKIRDNVTRIGEMSSENQAAVALVASETHKLSDLSDKLANQISKFNLS